MEHIICMLRYARSYIHNEKFVKGFSVTKSHKYRYINIKISLCVHVFMDNYSTGEYGHLTVVVYSSFF